MYNCHTQRQRSGPQRDSRLRLVAEEFRIKRLQELHLIIRRRVSSEEEHLKKQRQELSTLLYAEEQGLGSGCHTLEPQVALALARATRDALAAEEEAAKLRIEECEQHLETLKDAAEDAHARVEDANYQVGQVLSFFDHQEMRVDLRKQSFEPSPHHSSDSDWSIFLPTLPSPAKSEPWAGSHSASKSAASSCSQSVSDSDGDSDNEPSDSGPCHRGIYSNV